ncbi:hypothetical protein [Rhizobium sp. L43]|uniref:hypothetical protein n=1 Tax=Rhizobium sp. L43 TaxID=2035452 RepID=UPI000BE82A4B|nr:hypothetical protein [Rhizobium sp. L43]PDS79156.1 hypothetical protein CO667_10085 [Rhizobium sp. L43]
MSDVREKNDIAIAYKALCIANGLNNTERLVAAAILSHYSKRDGRCDPGIDRLARMLSIDERSVRRATNAICSERCGLFVKKSHGGMSGRASYIPQWDNFREIVTDWDRRMASGSGPEKCWKGDRTNMSGYDDDEPDISVQATGQKCPVEPDRNVRETNIINPFEEPISLSDAVECVSGADLLGRKEKAESDRKHQSIETETHAPVEERRTNWHAASAAIWESIRRLNGDDAAAVWAFASELGERSRGMRQVIRAEIAFAGAGLRELRRLMILHRLEGSNDHAASMH